MSKQKEPVIETVTENFQFLIKDLRFHYGGVSFRHLVPSLGKRIEFTIINYTLREEFDAVKNYFANVFDSKRIEVKAIIQTVDGTPRVVEAFSPQINRIDGQLLQSVKLELVKELVKKRTRIETKKPVITLEEFFEAMAGEEVKASAFYPSEKELADDFFKVWQTRHYHQLQYLSGRHAYKIMRLRFILKPFSFLFLLEGEKQNYIVWETLDTEEATYLWPVAKDYRRLKENLEKIGEIISLIQTQGKMAYRTCSEEACHRVLHIYNKGMEGFIKWKDELESLLL